MCEYFAVITSELGSPSNHFIIDTTFLSDKEALVAYCEGFVESLRSHSAEADYYIYKLE